MFSRLPTSWGPHRTPKNRGGHSDPKNLTQTRTDAGPISGPRHSGLPKFGGSGPVRGPRGARIRTRLAAQCRLGQKSAPQTNSSLMSRLSGHSSFWGWGFLGDYSILVTRRAGRPGTPRKGSELLRRTAPQRSTSLDGSSRFPCFWETDKVAASCGGYRIVDH